MPLLIAGGLALAGGVASGIGTASAQSAQNRANALAAGQQSAQSFYNYLASRGINVQQITAAHPELMQEWNRVRAAGDKRDFQTWFQAFITSHPESNIWDEIASPTPFSSGASNTTLPAWATIGGGAAQPVLFNQLLAAANPGAALSQVEQQFAAANPGAVDWYNGLKQSGFTGSLADAVREWYKQNPGTAVDQLDQGFLQQVDSIAQAGTRAGGSGVGIPSEIQDLISKSTGVAGSLFNGDLLKTQLAGLQPVLDARSAAPALINSATLAGAQGVAGAERQSAQGVYDANVQQLANLLGVRTEAAKAIYDASTTAAGGVQAAQQQSAQGVYDANIRQLANVLGVRVDAAKAIYDASEASAGGQLTAAQTGAQGVSGAMQQAAAGTRDAGVAGAQGVYGAQLEQAQTYADSAQQAAAQALAAQNAQRARQGFIGTSSGADLNNARLLAGYIQQGAGARAQAGVNQQQALANVGLNYAQQSGQAGLTLQQLLAAAGLTFAQQSGQAGVQQAGTVGAAQESDAQAKLAAAVGLAGQLGAANVGYAQTTGQAAINQSSTIGAAKEGDAQSKLAAALQLAQALGASGVGLATAQGNAGVSLATGNAQADYQNAIDRMNAVIGDQNRQVSAIGLPAQLAASALQLQKDQAAAPYDSIDALLSRLNANFGLNQASGPAITVAQPTSVINPTQILGGALTTAGQVYGDYSSKKSSDDSTAQLIAAIKALTASQKPTG